MIWEPSGICKGSLSQKWPQYSRTSLCLVSKPIRPTRLGDDGTMSPKALGDKDTKTQCVSPLPSGNISRKHFLLGLRIEPLTSGKKPRAPTTLKAHRLGRCHDEQMTGYRQSKQPTKAMTTL